MVGLFRAFQHHRGEMENALRFQHGFYLTGTSSLIPALLRSDFIRRVLLFQFNGHQRAVSN